MKTLKILSGGAAHGLVEKAQPAFEAATGYTVDGTFGAAGAMRDKLLAGEPADLMILSDTLIDELARSGHVVTASIKDVSRAAASIAVRAGDPLPPIATADDLRAAIAAADEIHLPDPTKATAGIHFGKVIRQLGLWDAVASRLRPAPNGATAMKALATSKAARPMGCTQETEIRATPGIALVGPLPPGCDLTTVYTAAVTTTAQAPAEAAQLIARLGTP